jgi:hypothetical protein
MAALLSDNGEREINRFSCSDLCPLLKAHHASDICIFLIV